MTAQIEFTDRYGGHPPSWLRGCFNCEAMGWVPVFYRDALGRGGHAEPGQIEPVSDEGETDPTLIALWRAAEAQQHAEDGWHFVRCPACRGTGRISWWRTLLRLPRWLYRGVRFVWDMGIVRNKTCRPAAWTWRREFVTTLRCAFLADLGLWRP